MTKWQPFTASKLYFNCIKNKHKPVAFKLGFSLLYLYCDKCQKIYRLDIENIEVISKDEWVGELT